MLDMFKKSFVPTKKDFKEEIKTKLSSLGFKSVPRGNTSMANSLSQEFEYNSLYNLWIVMMYNGEASKVTVRYNLGYNSKGLFSTVPAVYRFVKLDTPGQSVTTDGHTKIDFENIKDEQSFYEMLFKELDKLPTLIDEKMKALEDNTNKLLEEQNKKVIIPMFGPGNNTKMIMDTITITQENLVILSNLMDDISLLPNDIQEMFIF